MTRSHSHSPRTPRGITPAHTAATSAATSAAATTRIETALACIATILTDRPPTGEGVGRNPAADGCDVLRVVV